MVWSLPVCSIWGLLKLWCTWAFFSPENYSKNPSSSEFSQWSNDSLGWDEEVWQTFPYANPLYRTQAWILHEQRDCGKGAKTETSPILLDSGIPLVAPTMEARAHVCEHTHTHTCTHSALVKGTEEVTSPVHRVLIRDVSLTISAGKLFT